ncbi:MAG: oligoendopeptidase F [Acidobacteria bacterium RIFCSPLOWO2_12_FULL_65_11]|nr:MAG: oligoendopeptidase F [Acidobacteria bacterium RIFCSPLOWO2_02_FULL_64_15]OFW34489.1 MAG: oligoendopeptidase F [Acidobacteria bacterium RIFCSPLOWO2_12_FULL_65_11]
MDAFAPAEAAAAPELRSREAIPDRFKWSLTPIFSDWDAWKAAYDHLDTQIVAYALLRGTLAEGPDRLLAALRLSDDIGQLSYKVWYFASLWYDQDQRDNQINAKRQQVQVLFAKASQAAAWFNPELLTIPLSTVQEWMAKNHELAVYRFAVEDLYRQQEHVLDDKGEHLLSLASRFASTPHDAYAALSTADLKSPTVRFSTGGNMVLTYGQYRAILATNRNQQDRATAFTEYHKLYHASLNTYASLYHAVLQRDWFLAQSRGYPSTLDAALHGNNIPPSVVENLIQTTKEGTEPLRRYHRLRKRVLGLGTYHSYDATIPLVEHDTKYRYEQVAKWLPPSVALLGADYERQVRDVLAGRWIDVYENTGKRSGAYSAPVYGVYPYMLLNHNDTLDAAFTLAHEMGHSMHTLLANAHQPFVYSAYTIFVAEVPSTLSEALFLEYMLGQATDERERIVLLQHAIDGIVSTFYTQVLFADYELQAHRLVEEGRPVTAETLAEIYLGLLKTYHGDAVEYDDLARVTWARIPHFYSTPFYVYQYATCFASSAELMRQLGGGSSEDRAEAIARYLTLLKSGGSDHPMTLLARAGIDLSKPATVRAVVDQLDGLVTRLDREIAAIA